MSFPWCPSELPLCGSFKSRVPTEPRARNCRRKADQLSVSELRAVRHAEYALGGLRPFEDRFTRLEYERVANTNEYPLGEVNAVHAHAAGVTLIPDQNREFADRCFAQLPISRFCSWRRNQLAVSLAVLAVAR